LRGDTIHHLSAERCSRRLVLAESWRRSAAFLAEPTAAQRKLARYFLVRLQNVIRRCHGILDQDHMRRGLARGSPISDGRERHVPAGAAIAVASKRSVRRALDMVAIGEYLRRRLREGGSERSAGDSLPASQARFKADKSHGIVW
jgi:hypothetical protein